MQKMTAEYFGQQFELTVTERDELYCKGFLPWDEAGSERFWAVYRAQEEADEYWYLDDDGDRLPEDQLFEKSPWAIIEGGERKKVIKRFTDGNTGEVHFALQPWVRIGDEYNSRK